MNPTIVEALCATISAAPFFLPVKIGPHLREETFIGGPLGSNNPTRELLKEAGVVFGNHRRVAQIVNLGTGRPSALSVDAQDPENVASTLLRSLSTDCEMVASELATRLIYVDAYIRLNVDGKTECSSIDDWHDIQAIKTNTSAYLKTPAIYRLLQGSVQNLQNRIGTATIGQISTLLYSPSYARISSNKSFRSF